MALLKDGLELDIDCESRIVNFLGEIPEGNGLLIIW